MPAPLNLTGQTFGRLVVLDRSHRDPGQSWKWRCRCECGRIVAVPQFSEWMQGWPAGWVTDVPGMRDTWKHHAIGNGVVPQQAAAAIRWCLTAIDRYRMGAAA